MKMIEVVGELFFSDANKTDVRKTLSVNIDAIAVVIKQSNDNHASIELVNGDYIICVETYDDVISKIKGFA